MQGGAHRLDADRRMSQVACPFYPRDDEGGCAIAGHVAVEEAEGF